MSQPEKPSDKSSRFFTVSIRRKPLYEWLLWGLWLLVLLVLLEFTLESRREYEWQAATLAGALFLIVLVAGMIAGMIRRIEAEEHDKYH